MGRYVTPRGVVVEVGDEAARAVGYKAAEVEKPVAKKAAPKKASSSRTTKK